jgi:hypothetical protein
LPNCSVTTLGELRQQGSHGNKKAGKDGRPTGWSMSCFLCVERLPGRSTYSKGNVRLLRRRFESALPTDRDRLRCAGERDTATAGRSYREADGPVAALYRTLTATMRASARREWLKRGLHCPKLVCPLAEHPKLQVMRGAHFRLAFLDSLCGLTRTSARSSGRDQNGECEASNHSTVAPKRSRAVAAPHPGDTARSWVQAM